MKKLELYDDKIGFVELIDHMGTDLTIVNSARVSFAMQLEFHLGWKKMKSTKETKNLLITWSNTSILPLLNTMLLLLGFVFLCLSEASTCDIELGLITKSVEDILK